MKFLYNFDYEHWKVLYMGTGLLFGIISLIAFFIGILAFALDLLLNQQYPILKFISIQGTTMIISTILYLVIGILFKIIIDGFTGKIEEY